MVIRVPVAASGCPIAIAIGHPLAATGTRITIHLLHALRQQHKRFGLGSACIGGGQGAAVLVEAFPPYELPMENFLLPILLRVGLYLFSGPRGLREYER